MKKQKPNPTTTPETILSLDAITAMETPERLDLYRKCDERMRSQFLIQGKILHATEGGEEALRAAGIPRSSLHNAKLAAIALELTVMREEDKPVLIHTGGKKAEPFTEAVYDGLTLEQCRLLAYGCTSRGQVAHRMLPQTFYAILKEKEWDVELEHYFEHGATRAMKQAMDEQARQREAMLQTIDIPTTGEEETGGDGEEEMPAPEIVSVPPVEEEGEGRRGKGEGEGEKGEPGNIVPFVPTGTVTPPEVETVPPPKLEVLPPVEPEKVSFQELKATLDTVGEMLKHLDPVVCESARQELASRLRTLADMVAAKPVEVVTQTGEVGTKKGEVKKRRRVA